MSKTAQAIKSGVVMGGTAILSAVNGLTPHMAGAIDIMVVQQPDGTMKCSPFYVRFGKYTPMRSKDKRVQIFVNDEEAGFSMHLGAYGQAYFAAETMEIVSDADDELLTGMMSPSSGYSSDDEDGSTPYANASMLSAVQQEVQRLKAAKEAAEAAAEAATQAAAQAVAQAAEAAQQSSSSGAAPAGGSSSSTRHHSSSGGGGSRLRASQDGRLSGSESDGEDSSSSSSSSLSDLPSPAEVAKALQQGLAAGSAAHAAAAGGAPDTHPLLVPPGLAPISVASSNGGTAAAYGGKRRQRKHLAKRMLQVAGDGAEGDPARSRLQDMLLDNKYSIKMQSDKSFADNLQQSGDTAAGQQQQQQQQLPHSKPPLQTGGHAEQQHDLPSAAQQLHKQGLQQQQQRPPPPVRHVGFQLPPPASQHRAGHHQASGAAACAAAELAGANGNVHKVHAGDLPELLDPTASYSMDEVSEATANTTRQESFSEVDSKACARSRAAAAAAAAAAVAADADRTAAAAEAAEAEAAGAGEGSLGLENADSSCADMESQPTLADGLQDDEVVSTAADLEAAAAAAPAAEQAVMRPQNSLDLSVAQHQQQLLVEHRQHQPLLLQTQQQEELIISPGRGRDSLLSSSLKAQQQQHNEEQWQQQQQQVEDMQQEAGDAQPAQAPKQQQQQDRSQSPLELQQPQQQLEAQSQPTTAASEAAAAPAAVGGSAPAAQRSASVGSSQDADATAILDDAAAVMPSGWGMHPHASELQALQSVTHQQHSTQQQALTAAAAAAAVDTSSSSSSQQTAAPALDAQVAGEQQAADTAAVTNDAVGLQQQQATAPVSMPEPFAASPPVDSGYLGDTEGGALMGTSYEGATPRRVSAAAMAAAAGPLALGLAGFQLSLCGDLLRPGIAAAEAQQVFETRRISAEVWSERGVTLLAEPDLVVRIGGSLYSWQVAAPMVVGMLAFGGKWDNLLGLDPTGIYPIKVAEDHPMHTAKKPPGSSSSWRLWPFTGWRDPSGNSAGSRGGQHQPGSSPSGAPLPPAVAGGSASASNLQPSGGSFTNLKALLGPGSKSAPNRPGDYGGAAGDGAAAQGGLGGEGGDGRTASFMSTGSSPPRPTRKKHIILIRKTLTPTSEQLLMLPLKPGANTITFRAGGAAADLTAYIYLLRWNTRLVVSDVDGTITRSDLLGHVLPTLGVDWSHPGITQLFHNIAGNGYQIMFLSSRAIAQANITREYLHSLVQNDFKMPSGPVIISPHGLLPSLYREIVVRRPHEFKIACLQDIRALFPEEWNPFYAAFGNRDTDEVAYREVGVPLSRTFTINPKGQIQKASTAVQSSTWSSLSAINDLVDEMFPALLRHSNSSVNNSSRGLQSVYTSFTETLELAAAIGAIEQDAAAAACAEQQRRRSNGSSFDGAAEPAAAAAARAAMARAAAAKAASAAAAAAANSATSGSPTGQAEQAAPAVAAAAAPAAGGSVRVDVTAAAAAGDGDVISVIPHGPLSPENVGPAREEFNDLHFWRPALPVDIGDELAAFSAQQPQVEG